MFIATKSTKVTKKDLFDSTFDNVPDVITEIFGRPLPQFWGNMRSLKALKTGYKREPNRKADVFRTRRVSDKVIFILNCDLSDRND